MRTIEENLDRIATALEGIGKVLGVASAALNAVEKAGDALAPTGSTAPERVNEAREVDTATTTTRTKRPSRPTSGKGKVVEVNVGPQFTADAAVPVAGLSTAPSAGLFATPAHLVVTPKEQAIAGEKNPEKTVEKQGVTFAPEGAESLLDSIMQESKAEEKQVTVDDLITVARRYMEASKSINDKAVRKQKVIDILTKVGVNSIVKVEEKDIASVHAALVGLGA